MRHRDVDALRRRRATPRGSRRTSFTPTRRSLRRSAAPRAVTSRRAARADASRWNRVAFAAAHVVADPRAAIDPWLDAARRLGRDARLPPPPVVARLRRRRGDGHRAARHGARLADVARADPAQRRRGARRCRARSSSPARAPTTSRPARRCTLDDVVAAYEEQCDAVEDAGGRIILMASRALAACARSPDDYARGLRPRARAGARAGDPALAGRDVRPGARRLLGRRGRPRERSRSRARHGRLRRGHRGQRREGRRRQGLAARRRQGDRAAPPPAAPACACTPATTSTSPR